MGDTPTPHDAGRVMFIIKGTYDDNTAYEYLDVVYYNFEAYVAIKATQHHAPTDTEYWQRLLGVESVTNDPDAKKLYGNKIISASTAIDLNNYKYPTYKGEYYCPANSSQITNMPEGFEGFPFRLLVESVSDNEGALKQTVGGETTTYGPGTIQTLTVFTDYQGIAICKRTYISEWSDWMWVTQEGVLPIEKGGTGNADGYIRTGALSDFSIAPGATAEGKYNIACGECAHAEGLGCEVGIADSYYEPVESIEIPFYINSHTYISDACSLGGFGLDVCSLTQLDIQSIKISQSGVSTFIDSETLQQLSRSFDSSATMLNQTILLGDLEVTPSLTLSLSFNTICTNMEDEITCFFFISPKNIEDDNPADIEINARIQLNAHALRASYTGGHVEGINTQINGKIIDNGRKEQHEYLYDRINNSAGSSDWYYSPAASYPTSQEVLSSFGQPDLERDIFVYPNPMRDVETIITDPSSSWYIDDVRLDYEALNSIHRLDPELHSCEYRIAQMTFVIMESERIPVEIWEKIFIEQQGSQAGKLVYQIRNTLSSSDRQKIINDRFKCGLHFMAGAFSLFDTMKIWQPATRGLIILDADAAHAEGISTLTQGVAAHAEGSGSSAIGEASHAEGCETTASGKYSHASGSNTTAGYDNQFVCGKYNNNYEDSLFEVGIGTSSTRSTGFRVTNAGQACASSFYDVTKNAQINPYQETVLYNADISASATGLSLSSAYSNFKQIVVDARLHSSGTVSADTARHIFMTIPVSMITQGEAITVASLNAAGSSASTVSVLVQFNSTTSFDVTISSSTFKCSHIKIIGQKM